MLQIFITVSRPSLCYQDLPEPFLNIVYFITREQFAREQMYLFGDLQLVHLEALGVISDLLLEDLDGGETRACQFLVFLEHRPPHVPHVPETVEHRSPFVADAWQTSSIDDEQLKPARITLRIEPHEMRMIVYFRVDSNRPCDN